MPIMAQDLRELVKFGPSTELDTLFHEAARWIAERGKNVYDVEVKRDNYYYTVVLYWR